MQSNKIGLFILGIISEDAGIQRKWKVSCFNPLSLYQRIIMILTNMKLTLKIPRLPEIKSKGDWSLNKILSNYPFLKTIITHLVIKLAQKPLIFKNSPWIPYNNVMIKHFQTTITINKYLINLLSNQMRINLIIFSTKPSKIILKRKYLLDKNQGIPKIQKT